MVVGDGLTCADVNFIAHSFQLSLCRLGLPSMLPAKQQGLPPMVVTVVTRYGQAPSEQAFHRQPLGMIAVVAAVEPLPNLSVEDRPFVLRASTKKILFL